MNILDLIKDIDYTPQKKSSTHGGEYSSPCPFCKDGDDRFTMQPNRQGWIGGKYFCRVCGRYGDAIKFLRELHGLSYKEACEKLRIEPRENNNRLVEKSQFKPLIAEDPSTLWQEKSLSFINWCNVQLLADSNALSLVTVRGFSLETIRKFKIGLCPKTFYRERKDWGLELQRKDGGGFRKLWLPMGITIPTFSQDGKVIKVKIRRTDWKEGDKLPKYVEVSGSKQCPSIFGNTLQQNALILESELDGLLIQQSASDLVYCIALGGSTKPLDQKTDLLLRTTTLVLFCPDFDVAGKIAWDKWKKLFPKIHRILTPDGKAPGDAYLAGVNLHDWLDESVKEINRKLSNRIKLDV